ncbi:hypothetical protein [Halobellus salinisoli]|uniref:hypothetical protein n=1 Tax=Halobellus salinisoli TaxID=3108500 RepID=UPI00300B38F0
MDDRAKPDWWVRNERERERMDLPSYEPARFENGTYVHDVVSQLESRYDCTITVLGINTEYPDNWEVRVDGECAFTVDRSRDENGNTRYHLDAETFRERVERAIE